MTEQPVFRLIDGKPVMVWAGGKPLTAEEREKFYADTLGALDGEQS